jgi:hypothetical protein
MHFFELINDDRIYMINIKGKPKKKVLPESNRDTQRIFY